MRTLSKLLSASLVVLSLAAGCAGTQANQPTPAPAATAPAPAPAAPTAHNTLTPEEQAAGWRLLFDGQSAKGWRGFKSDAFPTSGWVVADGVLKHEKGAGGGDIVSEEQFDNFELTFEFRLTEGANSGIKYLIDESWVEKGTSGLGFEFQLLDDDKHPDAKKGKPGTRTCGALYDLIAPGADKVVNPIGEWNHGRLVVSGNRIEHWLNGKKVVEYERGSEALKAHIAESKYKSNAKFGTSGKGHILLQDHHDEVSFRNLKVRSLGGAAAVSAR